MQFKQLMTSLCLITILKIIINFINAMNMFRIKIQRLSDLSHMINRMSQKKCHSNENLKRIVLHQDFFKVVC